MLKKTITFPDLDGISVTEDFWFNLNKGELATLALSRPGGGLEDYLQEIIKSEDNRAILAMFKEILALSVGRRKGSRQFEKSDDITQDFVQSEAYSELLMELLSNPPYAVEFFNGILPPELVTRMEEVNLPEEREYSDAEYLEMSDSEFIRLVGNDPMTMTKRHLMLAFQRKNQQHAS